MQKYPTIKRDIVSGVDAWVFDKLDGSQVRAEWTAKCGFIKFGSRGRLVDDSRSEILGRAPGLILERYGDALDRVYRKEKFQKTTAFFEFFGPNSFAGWHDEQDQQEVVLFDIHLFKHGILRPRDFYKMTRGLIVPNLVRHGPIGPEFRADVYNGRIEGITFEGVVCKYTNNRRGTRMFKIKSKAWLERLKSEAKDEADFNARM